MKALSIRQPWAWLILHAGKDIENRDWSDRYPGLHDAHLLVEEAVTGGDFLIHAGKGMTRAEYEDCLETCHAISRERPFPAGLTLPAFADLPRGGIVGRAKLYDVVTEHASPWFFGRIGLVIACPEPLEFRPCKGALGFFEIPNSANG